MKLLEALQIRDIDNTVALRRSFRGTNGPETIHGLFWNQRRVVAVILQ